jgi:hypothetical protein
VPFTTTWFLKRGSGRCLLATRSVDCLRRWLGPPILVFCPAPLSPSCRGPTISEMIPACLLPPLDLQPFLRFLFAAQEKNKAT